MLCTLQDWKQSGCIRHAAFVGLASALLAWDLSNGSVVRSSGLPCSLCSISSNCMVSTLNSIADAVTACLPAHCLMQCRGQASTAPLTRIHMSCAHLLSITLLYKSKYNAICMGQFKWSVKAADAACAGCISESAGLQSRLCSQVQPLKKQHIFCVLFLEVNLTGSDGSVQSGCKDHSSSAAKPAKKCAAC